MNISELTVIINPHSMLPVGTLLQNGKYRIERHLSSGGFGNTYVATNIEFEEQVAIKEFFMRGVSERNGDSVSISVSNPNNIEQFSDQKEKFKKEAKRMFSIKNEHIIGVHDLFEENGTAYYVMDYVNGENLATRLKRTGQPMTEHEVRKLLPQILDALQAVHDMNIWHLDLKPANIMLDKSGNIILIDFGSSKQLNKEKGGATFSTAICYTEGYAPREQMEQNYDKFGPWTDIYALGATLYILLTNQRPPLPTDIDDDTSEDKHIALPMPDISEEMRNLVLQMMNTNRLQRPQTISEVGSLLSIHLKDKNEIESDDEETIIVQDKNIELLIQKAQRGNADAQYELGNSYFNGMGVEEDEEQAFEWYEKAAKQGHPEAQYNLGICYDNGDGVEEDEELAFEWYEKAAKQGNTDAQYNLGCCLLNGTGVEKDEEQAFEWYEKAAKQGHPEAQYNLGLCYENGYGVEADKQQAFEWYERAAEQGNADAQNYLRKFFDFVVEETDEQQAFSWYKKVAEKGFALGQYKLGVCYENGIGVKKDEQQAFKWYEKAAKQGNTDAQYALGVSYFWGVGVKEDEQQAFKWFVKANRPLIPGWLFGSVFLSSFFLSAIGVGIGSFFISFPFIPRYAMPLWFSLFVIIEPICNIVAHKIWFYYCTDYYFVCMAKLRLKRKKTIDLFNNENIEYSKRANWLLWLVFVVLLSLFLLQIL